MLRPSGRYRPYTRSHKLRFTVEIRGPRGEKEFETFRKALFKVLSKHKAKLTVKKRTPKK